MSMASERRPEIAIKLKPQFGGPSIISKGTTAEEDEWIRANAPPSGQCIADEKVSLFRHLSDDPQRPTALDVLVS
jgi:hypothetical protein